MRREAVIGCGEVGGIVARDLPDRAAATTVGFDTDAAAHDRMTHDRHATVAQTATVETPGMAGPTTPLWRRCVSPGSTPDRAAQRDLARKMQLDVLYDAPYAPPGQILLPTAYSASLVGVLPRFAKFWNVRRT